MTDGGTDVPPGTRCVWHSMNSRSFTLIEMLVVLVIIGLISALVVPRVGRLPAGIAIRRTISQVRNAFRMAAVRARGTGHGVTLRFDPDAHALHLDDMPSPRFSAGAQVAASPPTSDEAGRNSAEPTPGILKALSKFPVPKEVEWRSEDDQPLSEDPEDPVLFRFFPNGEASGPDLVVVVGKRRVHLHLERLTGRLQAVESDETP